MATDTTMNYNETEGTYYERVFSPLTVEVIKLNPDSKKSKLSFTLTDADGNEVTLTDSHAINRFFSYSMKGLEMTKGDITKMCRKSVKNSAKKFNKFFAEKCPQWKLYYDDDNVIKAIVSLKHRQFTRSHVFDTVSEAVETVYGSTFATEIEEGYGLTKAFEMPVENEFIKFYALADPGNNLIYGRSGIRVSTRLQTIFDNSTGGSAVPCMNWANLWQEPLRFFEIDAVRIKDLVTTSVTGMDDMLTEGNLFSFDIHLDSTTLDPEMFILKLRRLKELAEKIIVEQYIDGSLAEPLTPEEVIDILDAYSGTMGYRGPNTLPAYVINAILAKFRSDKDHTVWGFSQAVSYVRTHGELRGMADKGRNNLPITRKLENIAGEILSLTPTIAEFHKKVGSITFELLTNCKKKEVAPEITVRQA